MVGGSIRAVDAIGIRTWRTDQRRLSLGRPFLGARGNNAVHQVRFGEHGLWRLATTTQAVAAVLVGGTLIKGGEGSIVRTLGGVMIIAIIQAVLLLRGLRQEWQYLISGLIVLAVIILHTRGTRD